MDSSLLKIDRATKHIVELNELFRKKRPFTYILETNVKTGQRATYAKRDETVANEAAVIIGDVIHNLRASLDHAYWEILSPVATSDAERRTIQFPIRETKERLEKTLRTGLPSRISEEFIQAVIDLKPYEGSGGNEFLCTLHSLDIIDKHKLLIPTGNYTRITSEIIQREVPDFPGGLVDCGAGNSHRDVVWCIPPMNRQQRRSRKLPKSGMFEKVLNVPVDIIFNIDGIIDAKPVIETLREFTAVCRHTVGILNEFN